MEHGGIYDDDTDMEEATLPVVAAVNAGIAVEKFQHTSNKDAFSPLIKLEQNHHE